VSSADHVSIYGSCGEFDMPARDWRRILWVAQCYGWQPSGTEPLDELAIQTGMWEGKPADWSGVYFPCHGQQVAAADADAIASAIERALLDIPDDDGPAEKPRTNDPRVRVVRQGT
jgi:hypothetical protein